MRGLGVVLLLLFCACTSAPRPLPSWLRHIKLPQVDPAATLDGYEAKLIAELESGVFRPSRDTPPEQLAVLALHELQRDHPWDAAVLLGLASHRRWEQVWATGHYGRNQGWELADARSDGRIDRENYDAYLEYELEVLRAANFDEELARLSAKVGAPIDAADIEADVRRVLSGHFGDGSSAAEALSERVRILNAPPPERLAHPKLAAAVRGYLMEGVRMHRRTSHTRTLANAAANYLALVPIHAFRLASLKRASSAFNANVVRAGMVLYRQSPDDVRAALRMDRYASRSHAAVVLGLVADPGDLQLLQASWQSEKREKTRLSLAFALVGLGERQHFAEIERALGSDEPGLVEHASTLLQWMPDEGRELATDALLAGVLTRKGAPPLARFMVTLVLRDRSKKRALSEAALRGVLTAAYELRDEHWVFDKLAAAIGEIEQVNRAEVLRAIHASREPLEPWLARFVNVVTPADLPQITRWLENSDYESAHAMLVRAAAAIPGAQAQAALERWLVEHPKLSAAVAISLVARKDTDPARLSRLLEQSDLPVGAMFLELATGRPSAAQQLPIYLRSSELQDRLTATLAVELLGKPEHADPLWENIAFQDSRHYPRDLLLRHRSLSALIHVELNRSSGVRVPPSW